MERLCEQCESPVPPCTYQGGSPKRFCSEKCARANWSHANLGKRAAEQRRYQKANKITRAAAQRRRYALTREKHKARCLLQQAVRNGSLTRGDCESAGVECRGRVEGHHQDYSKPLDVQWLCAYHHALVHNKTLHTKAEEH